MESVCNEESTCLPQFIWVPNSRMKSAEHVQHMGGVNNNFRSVVISSRFYINAVGKRKLALVRRPTKWCREHGNKPSVL